jgi:hypothetical protein
VAPGHGAAASAVGYQYQTWWSLLEMLRTGPDRPDAVLTLEMHDDVAWDVDGNPTELLQTKHHQEAARTLNDASDDIWRTLLVWLDTASPSDPAGPLLHLVSTDVAPVGGAAYSLRPDSGPPRVFRTGDSRVNLCRSLRIQVLVHDLLWYPVSET